ncbi:MAG: hypothetical protein ACLFR0_07750 [Alphaproteobacteria bacterium]
MTTDIIQNKQLRMKARITDASNYRKRYDSTKHDGLELTRMQSFVDGGHDIFDVLEGHAANNQMKIKAPKANDIEDTLKNTPLFQSLLSRLKEQMREIM